MQDIRRTFSKPDRVTLEFNDAVEKIHKASAALTGINDPKHIKNVGKKTMPPEVRNQTSIGNRRLDPVRDQYIDSSRGRDQQPESVTTPRRSLFKLKLLSALDKLPFIRSATNNLTENTVPNSTEYRTAQALQTISKPNSSPDRIAQSILNTLPVDYTKAKEVDAFKKTVYENMKEQAGQLSDRQLYRAEKRMSNPKMQAVIAGLREQAKETTDIYNEQGHVLPEQLQAISADKSSPAPIPPKDWQYVMTQDDNNVYIDTKVDLPVDAWEIGEDKQRHYYMLDPRQTSLIGQSRIVVPKEEDAPPRLEYAQVQANLRVALAD